MISIHVFVGLERPSQRNCCAKSLQTLRVEVKFVAGAMRAGILGVFDLRAPLVLACVVLCRIWVSISVAGAVLGALHFVFFKHHP